MFVFLYYKNIKIMQQLAKKSQKTFYFQRFLNLIILVTIFDKLGMPKIRTFGYCESQTKIMLFAMSIGLSIC